MPESFLPQHGSYRHLRVYHVAEAIYDLTYHFVHTFLPKGDRTVDQMVQAARSGKQNIAEGNQAAATSAETELKLTNVAKASLEELCLDYEDYLRVRGLAQWDEGHPRYASVRSYSTGHLHAASAHASPAGALRAGRWHTRAHDACTHGKSELSEYSE